MQMKPTNNWMRVGCLSGLWKTINNWSTNCHFPSTPPSIPVIKVIVYKSRGELFLWKKTWDLGCCEILQTFCGWFFHILMGKTNTKCDFVYFVGRPDYSVCTNMISKGTSMYYVSRFLGFFDPPPLSSKVSICHDPPLVLRKVFLTPPPLHTKKCPNYTR